ncbi:MAG: hypothetical protein Q7U89_02525 [Coriobacteriia bacterium]|nr:hypothetical protein [Coriobacteriia bacterium]
MNSYADFGLADSFFWPRSTARGATWLENGPGGERFISQAKEGSGDLYQPLGMPDGSGPSLLDALTSLDLCEAGVSAFARKWGLLGYRNAPYLQASAVRGEPVRGESLESWSEAVLPLRILWRYYKGEPQNPGNGILVRMAAMGDGGIPTWSVGLLQDDLGLVEPKEGVLANIQKNSLVSWLPPKAVNDNLTLYTAKTIQVQESSESRAVTRAMYRMVSDNLNESARVRIVLGNDGTPEMRLLPQNLLGAAWLQFALDIDGRTKQKKCGNCNRWYVSAASGRGRPRQWCSASCRTQFSNAKKSRSETNNAVPKEARHDQYE